MNRAGMMLSSRMHHSRTDVIHDWHDQEGTVKNVAVPNPLVHLHQPPEWVRGEL